MIRIGHSWDTHQLVENRKLILGGITFTNAPLGLLGHSDADCVLHALAEALLGSLALGDLGQIFPDNSDETLNMDSKIILTKCYDLVLAKGYHLVNCDIMIYAEFIKITPYKEQIRQSIANILKTDISNVSVKATTWEKMGFIGKGKAIASEAVVLVSNE